MDRFVTREVIVVARPVDADGDDVFRGFLGAMGAVMESAAVTALGAVTSVAGPPTFAVYDRAVPIITDAVLQRLHILSTVLARVDLRSIVNADLVQHDLPLMVFQLVTLPPIVYAANVII